MKRIILLIIFLFLFMQAVCAKEKAADPYLWDFGKIKEGEVVKHVFLLKNESEKAFNIKGLHASCGCTTGKLEKESLLPQEEAPIEVEFNSKGYSGEITQFIYVNTDREDEPAIKFTVKAEVIKEIKPGGK
ncbi:MAG: DUF1573 domain-containing protein [Candidatus Omnitrophota bacterium]